MSGAAPAFLRCEALSKHYDGTRALRDVSLGIAAGEFVALVGASGSGKSTLLKCINRLVEPNEGRVLLDGQDVARSQPARLRRRIGYVFQGIGLFPHMTVGENIALGARLEGQRLDEARIAELLALVELEPEMAARLPAEMSGGQRQRVGVARALATDSHLLLMDEPFGALDPITRGQLGERVRRLHDELGLTTVIVTHDMAEALLLATRVLVMDAGRIVADATPAQLLAGEGGEVAQALVAVPRAQAQALAGIAP
ncbi:ABC transporter ATP-binding protein [Aurantiacibacter sp. MUD11]|uniref:ATP-binding cassette domain-containing protein n=1 Tax=Aurantiacibacter sp. MUD11 TaxID=3003265 RepID=UPI0022AA3F08|nr:ABC transporter ATP-binding protein [Aurantiacibacter sp. MUD11]WAT16941.1 ABC transporter ATP-binding protein [Aurantiacibacter sp. MUD11]